MEKTPWRVYIIKKPWEVSPCPQLSIILKILNMCGQVQFKTCHHQNINGVFILVFKLHSFLLIITGLLL